MIFKKESFHDFVTYIKRTNKEIICYGAGMLPLYTEQLFCNHGLARNVCLFIDGDPQKRKNDVCYAGRNVRIEMPGYLAKMDADRHVILITAERYKEIQRTLGKMELSEKWECYFYPFLNLSYFKSIKKENVFSDTAAQIPKVIHYIWFGGKKMQNLQQGCIESWRRFCPDFEIKEWNETNYDIHKNKYMEQAYENQKWAYVSDYARMDVLYRYGGIYLDTDVELFRSLNPLLNTKAFFCFGEWPVPNSGAGMGCAEGDMLIRELMETRERIPFIQEDGQGDYHTNSNYEMWVLMTHGFQMNFTFQRIDGITLYPPDVIAPVSAVSKNAFVTDRTLGMHHCQNTWRD